MLFEKVDVPTTVKPPPVTLTPLLAVINPTESIFVTSSFVKVPAMDTFPLNVASPVTARVDPSKVKLLLSSSSPPVPAITIRLSVRSDTAAEFAVKPPDILAPPFASIAPVNVEAPDTFTSSNSV